MPMVDTRMPSMVHDDALMGFSPISQLMEVMATSIMMVISEGPKFRPKVARAEASNMRIMMPMVPPMKEDRLAAISA